jgi:exosortase
LVAIVNTWNSEADYSHGYLVAPLALFFLWARRESFPGIAAPAYGLGLALLAISVIIRYLGARFYFSFLDGYSIIPWLACIVAMLGGRRVLWWALPSIGFLFFMFPMPFGAETAMSYPLQRIATKLSCATLQVLGQPAFAEGNEILLGEHRLEVAQACSGLRLFMSITAIAYAYIVLVRRAWWERALLLLAAAPIAIIANVGRIVTVGLAKRCFGSFLEMMEITHHSLDQFVGIVVAIPLAAALFAGVLWYLGILIREEEVMDIGVLVREAEA